MFSRFADWLSGRPATPARLPFNLEPITLDGTEDVWLTFRRRAREIDPVIIEDPEMELTLVTRLVDRATRDAEPSADPARTVQDGLEWEMWLDRLEASGKIRPVLAEAIRAGQFRTP